MSIIHHRLCTEKAPIMKWGATRGQCDLGDLPTSLSAQKTPPTLVLDFAEIEAANDSYIRSTVLWCLRCARLARQGGDEPASSAPWAIRPIPLEAIYLTGLSDEVRSEINLNLKDAGLACLEVENPERLDGTVTVLGQLDAQLRWAFKCLIEAGGNAVAAELWQAHQGDGVGLTAWNNRLSELFTRLLVVRAKEGKFWRYSTSTSKVTYGIQVHAA